MGYHQGQQERDSEREDGGDQAKIEVPKRRVLRSSAKGKGGERPLRDRTIAVKPKDSSSRTPSDPAECAQRLVDRLPKRRGKRIDEHETADEGPMKVKPRRSYQKRRAKARKAIKNEKPLRAKMEVCISIFDQLSLPNKLQNDKEREAIREYFKNLERYSLEKENVYVI
jgi:hypothetical protein